MKPLSEEERLDMFAMQIVHLVGRIQHEKVPDDATSKAFVDIRQASNDEAIEAVKDLIRKDRKAWGEYELESIFPEIGESSTIRDNLRAEQRDAIQKIRSRYE